MPDIQISLPPLPMRLNSPAWYRPAFRFAQKFAIGCAVTFRSFDKTCCDACPGFRQANSQRIQEVFVRREDGAIHVELDHACDLPIAANLPARSAVRSFCCVTSVANSQPEGLALFIKDRVIARQDPDLLAALPMRLYSAAWYSPRLRLAQNSRYAALSRIAGSTNML